MMKNNINPFDYILLPYQKKIFMDNSDFICVCASRLVGKSLTLSSKAVYDAIMNPKTLSCIISVNERSALEFLRKILQWAEACKVVAPLMIDYESNASSITFNNDSRIITLPASPASLRGFSGNVYWDEAGLCQNDDEMWAAMLPIITSKMSGNKKICVSSTPTSKNKIFGKIWFSDDKKWSKHKITIYDAVEQGLKADPETLKLIVNDPTIFDIEYMCLFASGYFDAFDITQLKTYKSLPEGTLTRYFGFDPARTNDGSAMVTIVEINGKLYLDDVDVYLNTPYYQQLEIIKQKNQNNIFSSGYIDAVGQGSMIAEEVLRTINARIKPLVWTSTNKPLIYERLRLTISNGELYVRDILMDKVTCDMAQVLRIVSDQGRIVYEAKRTSSTHHSDITSAISLALEAMHEMPKNATMPLTHIYNSAFGSRNGIFCRY